MSPIDDELRAALHGRAQVLTPSPDPLAGIEARATRMQRNRIGAAVAGSALAVALVAAVVPAVQSATSSQPEVAPFATSAPSAQPRLESVSYALDPENPWAFRGEPLDEGTRATIQGDYATRVQGAEVLVTPLFAQVYESSAQLEVVFLAEVDGAYRWGVATVSESGAEFLWDATLDGGREALAAALPGDEVPRLLVVASPETVALDYSPDGASGFSAMGEAERGVSLVALDGDPANDRYRVSWPGASVTDDAPDLPESEAPPATEVRPANALDWPRRGVVDPELEARAVSGFAAALGADDSSDVGHTVLFAGDNDPGQRYVVLQAWIGEGPAYSFGWIETPGEGPQPVLQPVLADREQVVAILLTGIPGRSTDELIVVPAPTAGEVLYRGTAGEQYRPVSTPGLDGVALVDRALGADQDELLLLDGDGDRGSPLFEGPVVDLLCGVKECG